MTNFDGTGRPYLLDVSYIGTRFNGFQSQADGEAVQDYLERALATYFRHPVKVKAASRTDQGVHAEHQIAVVETPVKFEEMRWHHALNSILPGDIGINRIQPLKRDPFDPISDAQGKAYRYRMWCGRHPNPFVKDLVWPVPTRVNWDLLAEFSQALVGEHDFTSFCNRDSDAKTRVRLIHEIYVDRRFPAVDFWIVGGGFLKQMVRIIVGTLVKMSDGTWNGLPIEAVLKGQDRLLAGPTAPARGLSLVHVFYDEIPAVATLIDQAEKGFAMAVR